MFPRLQIKSSASALHLDASPLTLQHFSSLPKAKWSNIQISGNGKSFALGDLFNISSGPSQTLVFSGDLSKTHYIGCHWQSEELIVEGDAGSFLGEFMSGGRILVKGNAGHHVSCCQKAGTIIVQGNVGDYAAGASMRSRIGMRGGLLIVEGHCGKWLAMRMRRGTVVIHGQTAAAVATDMLAGTLILCGAVEKPISCGMRRGTIVFSSALQRPKEIPEDGQLWLFNEVLDRQGKQISRVGGFTSPDAVELSMLPLLFSEIGAHLPDTWRPYSSRVYRSLGDRSVSGYGELIWLFPKSQ
ncbi:MAG: formylmethanofuran dehydrogenase subunit C [Planctomycetales bacterium]|nr:formylmethanofuran dehydrogenase subunit C [Planctomycetales bacterium]